MLFPWDFARSTRTRLWLFLLGMFLALILVVLPNYVPAAPVMDLTASMLLGGRVVVESDARGLFDQLRERLRVSPERFNEAEIRFLENSVFLTAVEFSLLRAVDPRGGFRFPLRIGPVEFRLAVMKTDTLDGGSCQTASRLMRERRIVPSDLFLFSGDNEKYVQIDPRFELRTAVAAAQFVPAYRPYLDNARNGARYPLTSVMHEGAFGRFESVLSWARLQFAIQRPPSDILEDGSRVLAAFGFR